MQLGGCHICLTPEKYGAGGLTALRPRERLLLCWNQPTLPRLQLTGFRLCNPKYGTLVYWIFQAEGIWERESAGRIFWPSPKAGRKTLCERRPLHTWREGVSSSPKTKRSQKESECTSLGLPQLTMLSLYPLLFYTISPTTPHSSSSLP